MKSNSESENKLTTYFTGSRKVVKVREIPEVDGIKRSSNMLANLEARENNA